ncbi:hypothetical protein AB0M75_06450 [Streptomyces anulatus]|uniref:hypothetical protein n=1 Tax=Streptomyces anulatus TaxID=1892 RepID=UPI00343F5452
MLGYQVHDVRIIAELRELPPEDGWKCWERTGYARLECSCGHKGDPMASLMASFMAMLHIHGAA